jgi:anaerobic ribonucleoside-triphosphate reductase
MDHMRERLMKYQKETNDLFNLEATPGEGQLTNLPRLIERNLEMIL